MIHYCPACKFFQADVEERGNGIGVCHRYPRLHLQDCDCYFVDVVEPTDWCGEWIASDEYLKEHIGETE